VRRLAPYLVATLLSLCGVSCAGAADPPLAVHVDWGLDSPSGMIPANVAQFTVYVVTGTPPDQSSVHTVMNLEDTDGDGHRDIATTDLPTGVPFSLRIFAQDTSRNPIYFGHVGPLTLNAGERRYVDLRMYQLGAYTTIDQGAMTPRMLATATALSDGRVLVSGGFTRVASMTCPSSITGTATCFDLTAASDAFIFDVASGTFLPVRGGLHTARGGHTATLLPGDRVLIAGGAAHAMLALVGSGTSYVPVFQSLDTTAPAGSSFEVFLPDANAETIDVDRNGDQGRGGFVGAADDPGGLGRLDLPRFMHAAAAVPGHAGQVLLAGGIETPDSWVIYDDARAGGYGVLDSTMNHLHTARPMPTIAPIHGTAGDALWIFGGGDAVANADLAEVWAPSMTLASGSTVPATMRMFPDGTTSSTDHPEYALIGATATALDAGHAAVVGWYGPLCNPAATPPTAPVFSGGMGLVRCDFPIGMSRSFTVDGTTGHAVNTTTHNRRAFGAAVRMSDGSVILNGGIGLLTLATVNTTDQLNPMVPATGAAMTSDFQPLLMQPRAFHAMAAFEDMGAIAIGGLALNTTGTPSIGLVGTSEALYLPHPLPAP